MPGIERQIEESRALIPRVYELEESLGGRDSPAVRAFALERARAAIRFTAALYLTAWEMSARQSNCRVGTGENSWLSLRGAGSW